MATRSRRILLDLFTSKPVVDLAEVRSALGGASRATAFRWLQQVPYRSSYNCNGRYFTLPDPSDYDRHGLYSVGDIYFSRDGTAKATVVRMVRESEAGCTQRELEALLRVRVRGYLLVAVREAAIARERIEKIYVYLHADPSVRETQIRVRRQRIAAVESESLATLDDATAIRVLLVLLRHPGSQTGDVVRHLQGLLPPINRAQVDRVFAQYGLGEKGGPRIF